MEKHLIIQMRKTEEEKELEKNKYSNFPLVDKSDPDFKSLNSKIKNLITFKKVDNISDDEFGWYLAGLIASDGSISYKGIEISFNINDISLGYYLKERLGVGYFSFHKTDKVAKFGIASREGIIKIINLTNGKFYSNYKLEYMKRHNYPNRFGIEILPPVDPKLYPITNNYFLAGFADGDGNFDIRMSKSKSHKLGINVILNFRIKQKEDIILKVIQENFGGLVKYYKGEDISEYASTSFVVLPKVIEYFTKYSLLSTKYINYLKWGKAAQLVFEKKHLTEDGLAQIEKIKNSMNTKLILNFDQEK